MLRDGKEIRRRGLLAAGGRNREALNVIDRAKRGDGKASVLSEYAGVRASARGRRDDYALEPAPIARGGQAEVFRAHHKTSGQLVAFKRLRRADEEGRARMRREVDVARELQGTPHFVPILDVDEQGTWLVMPLARGNLRYFRMAISGNEQIVDLLRQIATALSAAHGASYVHRDLTPANILHFNEEGWFVADWGLVRTPPGLTSVAGRTVVGQEYGTAGFAAPELAVDAHAADARADIYSIGQIIGWLLTDEWPLANTPLIPGRPPWDGIVRQATRRDPARRPQSIQDFLELVENELAEPPKPASSYGGELVQALEDLEASPSVVGWSSRRDENLNALFDLAANQHDADLFLDILPRLKSDHVRRAVELDVERAHVIIDAFRNINTDWTGRDFDWANWVIIFFLDVAKSAEAVDDMDLFEESVDLLFGWDDEWDRWKAQRQMSSWLTTLRSEPARVAARLLRSYPRTRDHFAGLATSPNIDPRVAAVLSPA